MEKPPAEKRFKVRQGRCIGIVPETTTTVYDLVAHRRRCLLNSVRNGPQGDPASRVILIAFDAEPGGQDVRGDKTRRRTAVSRGSSGHSEKAFRKCAPPGGPEVGTRLIRTSPTPLKKLCSQALIPHNLLKYIDNFAYLKKN